MARRPHMRTSVGLACSPNGGRRPHAIAGLTWR